jgi:hypothetical protein
MFRLDEFFRTHNDDVELPSGEKVSVRVLSDAEIQARSEYALSEQLKVQDALRDDSTDLYRLKVAPLLEATTEGLIETLAEVRRVDLMREANELFSLDFFPYPDDATEEEKLDTLRRQKDHESNVYATRAQYIVNGEISYRAKLADLPRETLVASAKSAATRLYVIKAQIDAELYYTVATAYSFLRGARRWTMDQVTNLPGRVLDFLMTKYREVDNIDPWELTKSLKTGSAGGVESGGEERSDSERPARAPVAVALDVCAGT